MAAANISVDQHQFRCPVCLDLLKGPVTIPCGHSYCMSCITDCWDQEDQTGIYKCPQCRETFTPRPVLGKNVVFAMVEKLKKTRLRAAVRPPVPPRRCSINPESGDVQCDSCSGVKQKAVKSCLDCRSSYCQSHLEQHESLFSKRHNLMDATGRLKEMICPEHDKILEIYCRTDQRCICILCLVDEHKNHNTVSTAAERKEKRKHLEEKQGELKKMIQQREKHIQELRNTVESHMRSAQTAVEGSERIFTELIRSIEKRRSEVTQMIRDQERAAVSRAEERLERLKEEIEDLKRRNAELKQLSQTQDHVHFLQRLQAFSLSTRSTGSFTLSSHLSFDDVVKSVARLRDKLQQFCAEETEQTFESVKNVQVILAHEYQTRDKFLQYSLLLTVNLNSVNYYLRLSEGNTLIKYTHTRLPYPDHLDRFDSWTEVMCRERVTGRSYWEVEWTGKESLGLDIGVSYKSIRRKGDGPESVLGRNDQSWCLFCSPNCCSFSHKNTKTELPLVSGCRIGVYVDHSAGVLSFYSVSDSMSLIHRVQTTFTQPLYAVFGLDNDSTVKLCRPVI